MLSQNEQSLNHGKGDVGAQTIADIYKYPDNINNYQTNDVVTIGDLHGNAAKFLHILIREGIVDIPKSDYEKFIEIYKTSRYGLYNLDELNNILSRVTLKTSAPRLRLIGDDLADRGNNDFLTLSLYQRLNQLNFKYEVIASNHGVEFLKQYAHGINQSLVLLYTDQNEFFGNSFYGLRYDILSKKVSADEVNTLIETNYLPHVCLLSYLIANEGEIAIYSHAPISQDKISEVAGVFGVEYKGNTVYELANTIDQINTKFANILSDKSQLDLFFKKTDWKNLGILDDFINDRYDKVMYSENKNIPSYQVNNIHGHVGETTIDSKLNNWSYENLDSDLGKTERIERHYYSAFISNESQFSPDIKLDVKPDIKPAVVEKPPIAEKPIIKNETKPEPQIPEPQSDKPDIAGNLGFKAVLSSFENMLHASTVNDDNYQRVLKSYLTYKRSLNTPVQHQKFAEFYFNYSNYDAAAARKIKNDGLDNKRIDGFILDNVLKADDQELLLKNLGSLEHARNQINYQINAFAAHLVNRESKSTQALLNQTKLAKKELETSGDLKQVMKILNAKKSTFTFSLFSKSSQTNQKSYNMMVSLIDDIKKEVDAMNKPQGKTSLRIRR